MAFYGLKIRSELLYFTQIWCLYGDSSVVLMMQWDLMAIWECLVIDRDFIKKRQVKKPAGKMEKHWVYMGVLATNVGRWFVSNRGEDTKIVLSCFFKIETDDEP